MTVAAKGDASEIAAAVAVIAAIEMAIAAEMGIAESIGFSESQPLYIDSFLYLIYIYIYT